MLRVSFFVHDQRGLFGFQRGTAAHHSAKRGAVIFQSAKGIENGQLFGRVQQRLMIVRTVHVHQPFAEGGQRASVVGEPLTNWRLAPALVKVRLRTS